MADLKEIPGPVRMTVLRKIAAGGMGTVYQALQHGVEGFAKTVALKTIVEKYSSNDEFVAMFIAEAKLVADLVHQNIVQVYHLGRSEGLLYIVMEYVDGVTLKQFVDCHLRAGKRIPVELAAYVASRACRGLEYAHKKRDAGGRLLGVVHRDISPNNIMLTDLGEIKLVDFGLAKARNLFFHREGDRLVGKVSYMAPEQSRMEPTDNRSDLFSLGIVLWEMLTGQHPLHTVPSGVDRLELMRAASFDPVTQHADVPPMLAEIVDRALEPDPADRYQDAEKMSYDLEYYMYHKGYGPTIVTMERYLQELFSDTPAIDDAAGEEETEGLPDTLVEGPPGETA